MAGKNERAGGETAVSNGAVFDALYENAPVGIAIFSIGGRFLRANGALCRLLGYTEEELLQKTHLDVVHLEDLEATAVSRAQVISGKVKGRIAQRRYVHKDGSTVWAHAGGAVVRDASGNAICTVLLVDDITNIKRSQRNAKRRFRRLIEMGSDWYWVQDTEFRFVEVPGIDMEHHDVKDLTLRLFTELLDEPEIAGLHAGVVIQAYLKDSLDDLAHVIAWSSLPPTTCSWLVPTTRSWNAWSVAKVPKPATACVWLAVVFTQASRLRAALPVGNPCPDR